MAEEVNYASVVFKSNHQAPPEAIKEEETVYDEVKMKRRTSQQTADTADDKQNNNNNNNNKQRRRYQRLACCFGVLCVVLLGGLVGVFVVLASLSGEKNKTTLLAEIHNLKNLTDKLSADNDNLRMEHNTLTVELSNLTTKYNVLDSKNANLTTRNQDLENQSNTLRQQIQYMETNWTELNISRAQWSIDTYCIHNAEGKCEACRKGWLHNQKTCYVTINPNPPGGKTWTEARENCREKNADFPVVLTEEEKNIIDKYSYGDVGDWIGLRVEDGKWKWIDGTELNQISWIGPPVDGHCAVSTQSGVWRSVSCDLRKQWICVQDALSV
ncbi:asialoglycoprotein receptor 1-like isoform X1 [Pseudoliparis swirei]|uniref:asialoglycoprotein receptor 1-like isoform X1 n=1 Tax=Pseudoliparis swirei TaxID=2059687 RepID=UPI0024BED097|nr:asialoglycoprotein receptor 1-like isoform X1 [Pseudoliparis swirei]